MKKMDTAENPQNISAKKTTKKEMLYVFSG